MAATLEKDRTAADGSEACSDVIRVVSGAPKKPEAFLRWLAEQPGEGVRYELSKGVVTAMMIWVTRAHWKITNNIVFALARILDDTRFDVGSTDFGVKTPVGIRFPDVLVDSTSDNLEERASRNPIFIAEVLSKSTMGVDFHEKPSEYMAIASLETYLVCAQDEARVWVWQKRDGAWPDRPEMLVGPDHDIVLGGLDVTLETKAIYRGIVGGGRASQDDG